MVIETYDELGEWDCPLCPDPVVRGDEVIVVSTGIVAHADCVQQPLPDLVTWSEQPTPVLVGSR